MQRNPFEEDERAMRTQHEKPVLDGKSDLF
jgi:hypothetical protein